MSFYIYEIKNKLNEKTYIGKKQLDFNTPLTDGYYGSGKAIKAAIKKYGIDNFEKQILIENIPTEKIAFEYEIYYIAEAKKQHKAEYNLTHGGDGVVGYKFTEEQRHKISISKQGKHLSEEHKQKLRKIKQKNPFNHSEKTKQYLSKIHSGEGNPMYGKHLSEEHKQKIQQTKQKNGTSNLGKKFPQPRQWIQIGYQKPITKKPQNMQKFIDNNAQVKQYGYKLLVDCPICHKKNSKESFACCQEHEIEYISICHIQSNKTKYQK